MPLDRQEPPRPVGTLEGLHQPVVAPTHGHQAIADPLDALMVDRRAIGQPPAADGLLQQAALAHPHTVGHEHPRRRVAVGPPAQRSGQVLVQCAAGGDVDHLGTPADGEGRDPHGRRRPGEAQLQEIAILIDPVDPLVDARGVVRRVDVAATGQDQAGEGGKDLLGGPGVGPGQDDRSDPGPTQGIDVVLGQGVRAGGPSLHPAGLDPAGRDRHQGKVG